MARYGYAHEMAYVTSYNATLAAPEVIGVVPEGLRLNVYVTGGTVDGPQLKGRLLPVGGDWLTVRSDGVVVLDVRATIQTDDDALIYVIYRGISDCGPDGYRNFVEGAPPPKDGLVIRSNPWFQTAHPRYQWLTRSLFVGVGVARLERQEVTYDLYCIK